MVSSGRNNSGITLARVLIALAAIIIGFGVGSYGRSVFERSSSQHTAFTLEKAEDTPRAGLQAEHEPVTIPGLRSGMYLGSILTQTHVIEQTPSYTLSEVYYTSDGLRVYGTLGVPTAQKPDQGYPTIIVAHGFADGSTYDTAKPALANVARGYLEHGYATFTPAYRGFGKSWGVQESAYYASGDAHDILNATASIKKDSRFNSNRVGIVGHSLGGALALKVALAKPHDYYAVAIAAASTGLPEELYNRPPTSELSPIVDHSDRNRLIHQYGTPVNDSDFWRQTASVNYLEGLSAPLYITHCSDDPVVPVDYSLRVKAALQKLGKPAELHTCDVGGHGFEGQAQDLLAKGTLDFFTAKK